MKKCYILLLAAVLGLSACGAEKQEETQAAPVETTEEEGTAAETAAEEDLSGETEADMENPWTLCESLEEAEKLFGRPYGLAGADALLAEYLFNTEVVTCQVMEGVLEVKYGEDLVIRQGIGADQDISGVYIDYPDNLTVEDCGTTVTMCGEEGQYMLALFSWEDCSYSVFTGEGTDVTFLMNLTSVATGIPSEGSGGEDSPELPEETTMG